MQALENLARTGQLIAEPTSAEEISGFLLRAEEQLIDARTANLSAASRFSLAYDAAHAFALVALRVHGYRPGRGLRHRIVVFSTLVHTVASPAAEWAALVRYHTKRNSSEYAGLVNASEAEARDSIEMTSSLRDRVRAWLGWRSSTRLAIRKRLKHMAYCGNFHAGYSPERINPGDKEHRLTTIKKITSGSTSEAADFIDQLYASIITAGTHKASSIKVAEAAKVIENTQRDVNIALINELALICNRIGIDTQEVLAAAGTKWNFLPFRPGLVAGHCIGVDPYYLTHKAQELGYHPEVILAGRRINDNMGFYVAAQVVKLMAQKGIAVGHRQFADMGSSKIHALGKPNHVLYDVKYLLPARDSDARI